MRAVRIYYGPKKGKRDSRKSEDYRRCVQVEDQQAAGPVHLMWRNTSVGGGAMIYQLANATLKKLVAKDED